MCTHDLHDAHPSHESFSYIFKFPLENHSKMCWKAMPKILPFFLAARTGFWWHFGTQNRSKMISKSLKIVLAPKKRHRAPPKASKKAPEASAAATGCLPKLPKTAPRSLKRVKVICQFTLVYSLQWTQISHTRKSRCQFTVHRLWSVPDCSRLTIRCSRFSVSRLP